MTCGWLSTHHKIHNSKASGPIKINPVTTAAAADRTRSEGSQDPLYYNDVSGCKSEHKSAVHVMQLQPALTICGSHRASRVQAVEAMYTINNPTHQQLLCRKLQQASAANAVPLY